MKLKTLEIKALRGIRDWEIPFDGKSLVLWGETASGKSSVVDALEFLFTGQVRHLVGTRGLSVEEHAPHVELGGQVMEVSATFDPGAIRVSRSLDTEPSVPGGLEDFWRTASSGAFILRRSHLLEFVYADPADRFRAVAAMIGAESLDEIELALMRARDQSKGRRQAREGERERIIERLMETGVAEPSEPHSALEVLNQDVLALGLEALTSLDREYVAGKLQTWLRSAKLSDQGAVGSLQQLKGTAEAAQVPTLLPQQIREYQDAHSSLFSERAKLERLAEIELLAHGEKVMTDLRLSQCPLCEQPLDLQDTLSRIGARRLVLKELSDEVSALRQKQHLLLSSLRSLRQRIGDLEGLLVVMREEDRRGPETAVQEFATQCEATIGAIESSTDFARELKVDGLTAAIQPYMKAVTEIAKYASEEQQALALTARDRSILALTERTNSLAALHHELDAQNKKLNEAQELERRAEYVFETLSTLKKAEITRVYDGIQADIRKFYETLHPSEAHGDFHLVLAEGRRASTELRIRSFGQNDVDPRAFTSEGHLDSLGLCIFLAFVKQFGAGCRLVVLDDVIMSVDGSHRDRVAALLLTEFENWQLIVTTHDEIWLEELTKHQRAYAAEGRFINLKIRRWTLQEGPAVSPYRPRWDRIEDKLNDADKTGAANEGRQFLEWILFEICTSTEAPVPLTRDARYTVEDLLHSARKRLAKLLPASRPQMACFFQEIVAAGTPGNLLSHYNFNAQSASIAEIRRFCVSGKDLTDWYQCASCGTIPTYSRQFKVIRCANDKCPSPEERRTA